MPQFVGKCHDTVLSAVEVHHDIGRDVRPDCLAERAAFFMLPWMRVDMPSTHLFRDK